MLAVAVSVLCVFKSSEAMSVISETSAEWSDEKKPNTLFYVWWIRIFYEDQKSKLDKRP